MLARKFISKVKPGAVLALITSLYDTESCYVAVRVWRRGAYAVGVRCLWARLLLLDRRGGS